MGFLRVKAKLNLPKKFQEVPKESLLKETNWAAKSCAGEQSEMVCRAEDGQPSPGRRPVAIPWPGYPVTV